jgi:ubiquinone/menaquinone biosynthesis C-methylase UbiE
MGQFLEVAAEKTRGLNWTSTNIAKHSGVDRVDMRDLPTKYKDNSFDGIYSEHFIEHLYKYQGINFFKEAFRILKPGGTIRTVWPPYEFVEHLVSDEPLTGDEEYFCANYHNFYVLKHKFAPPGNKHRSIREQCALGLLYQNGEHLYVWPKQEMMETLKDIGFKRVKEYKYQESGVLEFKGIDTPGHIRALHSAVVEATKP